MTPTARPLEATGLHAAAPTRPIRSALPALALAASLALVACGGGGSEDTTASADVTRTPADSVASASTADTTPDATQRLPNRVAWSTTFSTTYQAKTASDLGLSPQALNSRGDIAGILYRDNLRYAGIWHEGQIQSVRMAEDALGCHGYCSTASINFLDNHRNLYVTHGANTSTGISLWREGTDAWQGLPGCVYVGGASDSGQVLCRLTGSQIERNLLLDLSTLEGTVVNGQERVIHGAGTRAGLDFQTNTSESTPVIQLFTVKGANISTYAMHGYADANVTGINAQDMVIGWRALPANWTSGRTQPFAWKPGSEPVDLPCPSGYHGTPKSINRDGTTVGECSTDDGSTLLPKAVLWKDGQPVDLGAHVDAGWTLTSVSAINDLGWILVRGRRTGAQADEENLVLMPQP